MICIETSWSRVVGVGMVMLATMGLWAQEKTTGSRRAGALPPPPSLKSPVDYFRQLLAASDGERERLLTNRPVAQRSQFRAIIKEYERCTPEERERRLQALELRFLITSILRLAPELRPQAVEQLSQAVRPLVRARLDYWNQLAPDVQQALLENERLMRIVTYVSAGRVVPGAVSAVGSNELNRVESAVRNWNRLPEGKRMAAEQAFNQVFELGGVESAPNSTPLSPAEHDEMRRVLERFKNLSPVQRSQCIRNLPKLAGLSTAERADFLRSADEWQRMSVEDREAWKSLVKRVPVFPPMPSGFRTLPPMPVRATLILPGFQTATNGNH